MEHGDRWLPLGAQNGLNRYLSVDSETFVDPRFDSMIQDWYSHWGDASVFGAGYGWNHNRWVRFHYLPRSREYPRTARDDREILRRYSEILAATSDDGGALTVVAESHSRQTSVPRRRTPLDPGLRRVLPNASWLGVQRELDDDDAGWSHLWVSQHHLNDPAITALFNAVTAEHERPTFLTQGCRRLFKPYEGGVDVWLESSAVRDSLAARFSDWLSPRREWIARHLRVEVFPVARERWIAVINAQEGPFSTETTTAEAIPQEVTDSIWEVLGVPYPDVTFVDDQGEPWSTAVASDQAKRLGFGN